MGLLRSHLLLLLLVASSAAGSLLRTVPEEPSTISSGGVGGGGGDALYCDSWRLSVETNDTGPWTRVPARCIEFVAEYMNGERCASDSEVIADEVIAFAEAVLWPPRDLARLWLVLSRPRAWNELKSRLHILHTKAPSAAPRVAFFLLRIASSIALVWVDESDSNRFAAFSVSIYITHALRDLQQVYDIYKNPKTTTM